MADPKIANAVVRTARRAYIIGVAVGQTNIYFFDAEGKQIAGFDIAVTRDLNGMRAALKQALPDADIRVEGLGDGVMLSGIGREPGRSRSRPTISPRGSPATATRSSTASRVRGRDQVMLKVTVAEVQRDVIKQLGIDLSGSLGNGTAVLNFNNANPFPVVGQALVDANGITGSYQRRQRDAARDGARRRHPHAGRAEPDRDLRRNRELPRRRRISDPGRLHLRPDRRRNCQTQIQFKKFGVGLNFTPVVLSEGRISLKVHDRSVRAVDRQRVDAQRRAQRPVTLTIPSIKTRRAETTVEIPSGGSLAMAGMIQEQTKQQINGMPGLMQLPVLGALFKSRDYVNRQTELMVIVTPYIVRAVAQKDLSRPDDGYADASDPATILLGRFNRSTARRDRTIRAATELSRQCTASFSIETRDEETIDAL